MITDRTRHSNPAQDVLSHFAELLFFLVTVDVDLKLATDKPLASMYLYEVNVDLTM